MNSVGLRSHSNAAILVCCWLALVLIVPTALNLALQATMPAPSRLERIGEVRRADLEAQAHRAELLADFFHEHPDLAVDPDGAAADFTRSFFVIQREIEEAVRPLDEAFEARLKAQQEMARRFQFVSPALVAQQAFNDVAGTGVVRHWSFVEHRLDRNPDLTIQRIAEAEGVVASYATRLLRLSFLAPDIVVAILDGRQPPELTANQLMRDTRLPLEWTAQRQLLGFPTA